MQSSKLAWLDWKIRRVAAGMRLQDVSRETGLSITRVGEIERGLRTASALEQRLIEAALPSLAASFEARRGKKSPSDSSSDGLLENST